MIRLLTLIIAAVALFGCNCPFDNLFSEKKAEACPQVKATDKKDIKKCPKANAKVCPKAKDCKTAKCTMVKDCKTKACPKAAAKKAVVAPKAAAKKAVVAPKAAAKKAVVAPKAAAKKAVVAPKAKFAQNSKTGVYKVGEQIIFNFALTPAENKVCKNRKVTFSCYGDPSFKSQTITLDKDGKATITYTAKKPGYYRVYSYVYKVGAGAIVSPYEIKAARPVPKDFNSYWDNLIKVLDKTPLKPTLTPTKSPIKNALAYDLQLPCPISKAGVSGYFTRPVKAAPKSLPAILYVHGAGVYSASASTMGIKALALNINAHGIKNGQPKSYYNNLYKTTLKNYWHIGIDNRDTAYFRDMALRVYRALQFLKAQPEWNQKVLIVSGGSQGGAQALMGAGLDRQVSAAVVHVPAVCDHGGSTIGRESGWPRCSSTPLYKKSPKKCAEALDYVDCVNFASRIKTAKIYMTTGTIDTTCVPSSVCAAFNAIPSKDKKLDIVLNMPHRIDPSLGAKAYKFITNEFNKK